MLRIRTSFSARFGSPAMKIKGVVAILSPKCICCSFLYTPLSCFCQNILLLLTWCGHCSIMLLILVYPRMFILQYLFLYIFVCFWNKYSNWFVNRVDGWEGKESGPVVRSNPTFLKGAEYLCRPHARALVIHNFSNITKRSSIAIRPLMKLHACISGGFFYVKST